MTPYDLRVGCCGTPTGLAKYATTFPVVEVQQTFYQPPRLSTLNRWRSQVPRDFEFTLKAWQLITHEASSPTYRRLREKLDNHQRREAGAFRLSATVMAAWQRTLECARALASRIIVFQSPAGFLPTKANKANLKAFFREIRRVAPSREPRIYVWEPRGKWKPEEVRDLCDELSLVHGVDPFPQHPTTPGLGYFRLHGRTGYRYRYTEADLQALLKMARAFVQCSVLFNNISMLKDAKSFQQLASRRAT